MPVLMVGGLGLLAAGGIWFYKKKKEESAGTGNDAGAGDGNGTTNDGGGTGTSGGNVPVNYDCGGNYGTLCKWVIYEGCRGIHVKMFQEFLNNKKGKTLSADCAFGSKTATAMKEVKPDAVAAVYINNVGFSILTANQIGAITGGNGSNGLALKNWLIDKAGGVEKFDAFMMALPQWAKDAIPLSGKKRK